MTRTEQAVLDHLRQHGCDIPFRITTATGRDYATVKFACKSLMHRGLVKSTPDPRRLGVAWYHLAGTDPLIPSYRDEWCDRIMSAISRSWITSGGIVRQLDILTNSRFYLALGRLLDQGEVERRLHRGQGGGWEYRRKRGGRKPLEASLPGGNRGSKYGR